MTGANGADASTGGRIDRSGDGVLGLVKVTEETSPSTPGWSLRDLDLAMTRLGVPFEVRSGQGWDGVIDALDDGLYVALQGDSDVFASGTCSGEFDGPHCIGLHPTRDYHGWQRFDDPICPGGRYGSRVLLRQYAEKFFASVHFGVFLTPVPDIGPKVVLSAPVPTERNVMVTAAAPGRMFDLAKGQPLFRHPGGPRVTAMSRRALVTYGGSAGPGWVMVRVMTGAPYRSGVPQPTWLYVPKAAGVVVTA